MVAKGRIWINRINFEENEIIIFLLISLYIEMSIKFIMYSRERKKEKW